MPRRIDVDAKRDVLDSLSLHKELTWKKLLATSGISKGALSYTLRELIERGDVSTRADESRRPPRTIYFLTPLGRHRVFTGSVTRILSEYHRYEDEAHPFEDLSLYSETDLSEFLSEESMRKIALTLHEAQMMFNEVGSIVAMDFRAFFERSNFSRDEVELIEFYRENLSWFRDLESRRKASGVVSSSRENEEVVERELEIVRSQGFESVQAFNDAFKPRSSSDFHRQMKGSPLTFSEDEGYKEMRDKFEAIAPLFSSYGEALEKSLPRVCLLMYNWEFEEEVLMGSSHLVRAGPGREIREIRSVLADLSQEQLVQYRDSMLSFLGDPAELSGPLGPEWPGSDEDKMLVPSLWYWGVKGRKRWGNKILVRLNERLKV